MAERKDNPRRIVPPSVAHDQQVNLVMPDITTTVPGDLEADVDEAVVCIAKKAGRVKDVTIAVQSCGKDDDTPLTTKVDVFINGVTCLTVPPTITHISGEADDTMRSSMVSGEGNEKAIIDPDANSFARGDLITYEVDVTLTGTPAGYMNGLGVLIEVDPYLPRGNEETVT